MIILRQRYFSEAGKRKLEERAKKRANKTKWLLDNHYNEERAIPTWIRESVEDCKKRMPDLFPPDETEIIGLPDKLRDARGELKGRKVWYDHIGGLPHWDGPRAEKLPSEVIKSSDNPLMASINLKADIDTGYKKAREIQKAKEKTRTRGRKLTEQGPVKTRIKDLKSIIKQAQRSKYRRKLGYLKK